MNFWTLSPAERYGLAARDAVRRGLVLRRVQPLLTGLWMTYETTDGRSYTLYDGVLS